MDGPKPRNPGLGPVPGPSALARASSIVRRRPRESTVAASGVTGRRLKNTLLCQFGAPL